MSTDPTKKKDDHVSTSQALDDEQRVKVLSPGMLVAKSISSAISWLWQDL